MSAAVGFSLGPQEWVRNSRGKRAINVRATEGLLYSEGEINFSGCEDSAFSDDISRYVNFHDGSGMLTYYAHYKKGYTVFVATSVNNFPCPSLSVNTG